jgi:hypothetical protein
LTIHGITKKHETIDLMLRQVIEEYAGATHGVVVIFDAEGGMHTLYHCNAAQMALASVRLAQLTALD